MTKTPARDKGKSTRDDRSHPNPARAQVRTDAEEATAQHEKEMRGEEEVEQAHVDPAGPPVREGIPAVEKGEKTFVFTLGGDQPVHLRLPGDPPRESKKDKPVEPTNVGDELELSHRQAAYLRSHGICLIPVDAKNEVPQVA